MERLGLIMLAWASLMNVVAMLAYTGGRALLSAAITLGFAFCCGVKAMLIRITALLVENANAAAARDEGDG